MAWQAHGLPMCQHAFYSCPRPLQLKWFQRHFPNSCVVLYCIAHSQVLEEVPDRLAPKPGQQQQPALPRYPHPPLSTLFASKPRSAAAGGTTGPSYHDMAPLGPAASGGNSSGLLSATASEERMARAGSNGSNGSSGAALVNKHVLSPAAAQRRARSSDPTDSVVLSERFAGSPSPRTAASMDTTRPGSAGRAASLAAGVAAAPSPVASAPAAAVGGLVGASGTPRVRTAEEIRQAYGRVPLSKAQVRGLRC
jgi:hypothetical protein